MTSDDEWRAWFAASFLEPEWMLLTPEQSLEIAAWVDAQDFPCPCGVENYHGDTTGIFGGEDKQRRLAQSYLGALNLPEGWDADKAALIMREVSVLMRVEIGVMLGRLRTQHVAMARQLSMYLMRELTTFSYPQIGEWFGRDYSTVIHAHQHIERRMAAEREFAHLVEGLLARVGSA